MVLMCAEDISYAMTMDVASSWQKVKKLPNYQDLTGDLIFSR
jgi:hypothetical protein